jgi:hypothetical protein
MNLTVVLEELKRRQRRTKLLADLHPGQRRILEAMITSRFIAVRSPRRWGKTEAALRIGLATADRLNARCLYLSQYRTNAKSIAWPIATELNETLGWTTNLVELALRGPGQRELMLMGADRPDLARLLRGWKNCVIIIDEAQDWSLDLRPFINSILRHTLTDLRGFLIVLGTPGWQEEGFYWSATQGLEPEWAPIIGGRLENPHTAAQQLEEMEDALLAAPDSDQQPWWKREYEGLWVADSRALVYPFSDRNGIYGWTQLDKSRILSIDWGSTSYSAFVVCEFDTKYSDKLDYVDAFQEKDVSLDRYIQIITDMRDRWSPIMTIADPGGTNKALTDEISLRCRIPIQMAEKTDKEAAIAAMVRDLSLGTIRVAPQAEALLDCWRKLVWAKRPDGTREERGENHLADAALYARRAAWNWTHKPQKPAETEEKKMFNEARKRAIKAQKRNGRSNY